MVGISIVDNIFNKVDFPDPDGYIMPTNSPSKIVRSISWRAVNMLPLLLKTFLTCFACNTGFNMDPPLLYDKHCMVILYLNHRTTLQIIIQTLQTCKVETVLGGKLFMKVLLVEDEPTIRETVADELENGDLKYGRVQTLNIF